ncbi:signal peptide containing protein [Theileria equi strain WA]|uniref:Signal peptide containing protein n=1 Tax=Theileria equi strain WA TaxID=1537102 RepID=L1LAA9_THEEQ|nr:signal peptide containing protein [Theileria equi strain WA]EKX72108.1 signal peptide containing protein [Theileria equi strain WA]|eukprot:XP_004831560.1 signal peptide containing protein [Theileria equi strain WA]
MSALTFPFIGFLFVVIWVAECVNLTGESFDISGQGDSRCSSFQFHFDDVPANIIVPSDAIKVTALACAGQSIWTSKDGRGCALITLFFRGQETVLVDIIKDDPGKNMVSLLNDGGAWTVLPSDDDEKYRKAFTDLRLATSSRSASSIDLTENDDTCGCKTFETVLFGVQTRFHVPQPGHLATEVVRGGRLVWRGGDGERCIATISHFKNGELCLFNLVKRDQDGLIDTEYFEKVDEEWKAINVIAFDSKLEELGFNDALEKNESVQVNDKILV